MDYISQKIKNQLIEKLKRSSIIEVKTLENVADELIANGVTCMPIKPNEKVYTIIVYKQGDEYKYDVCENEVKEVSFSSTYGWSIRVGYFGKLSTSNKDDFGNVFFFEKSEAKAEAERRIREYEKNESSTNKY